MKVFLNLAALAAVLTAASAVPARADGPHDKHMEQCAKTCADCMLTCKMNAHHCFGLVKDGKKEHAKASELSAACAEFCALSASQCAGHSALCPVSCDACAKACEACAAECEKFPDSKEMAACAKSCRECAKSCKDMVAMMGPPK